MMDKFTFSDCWLLMSIGFSKRGCKIKGIISSGDYLNKAVFTLQELNDGLNKLIFNEYVFCTDEKKFYTTEKTKIFYKQNKKHSEGCIIQLFRLSEIFKKISINKPDVFIEYVSEDDYNKATKRFI